MPEYVLALDDMLAMNFQHMNAQSITGTVLIAMLLSFVAWYLKAYCLMQCCEVNLWMQWKLDFAPSPWARKRD